MSPWGWRPGRTQGIWRHGPLWFKPLVVISPWAATALCFLVLFVVGNTLTVSRGVLFELPDAKAADGATTSLVALVMPLRNETTVFFDDARYALGDGAAAAVFGKDLADRIRVSPQKTLLVLADRRIPCGDLIQLASIARSSGTEKVLFANRNSEAYGE